MISGLVSKAVQRMAALLYGSGGAALIGFGAQSVAAALVSAAAVAHSIRPVVIRQHWGALRGTWYVDGEANDTFTVSAPVAAGAQVIALADETGLEAYQLICYLGSDGEYYTNVIEAVDTGEITVFYPLEAAIAAGDNLFSFYANASHPNVTGYKALADYALRQVAGGVSCEAMTIKSYRDMYTNRTTFTAVGDGALSMANGGAMNNRVPGTPTVPALALTTAAGGGGFKTPLITLENETVHKVRVLANPGTGGVGTIKVKDEDGNVLMTIDTPSESLVNYFEGYFMPAKDKTVYVEFRKESAGGFMQVASVDVIELGEGIGTLNKGVHVALGDSWFAQEGLVERLEERLPGATFHNAGTGGETLLEMLDRFDDDVTPHAPQFVWIMSGTNEAGREYSADTYTTALREMLAKIAAIGAKAIVYDASVGAKTAVGHDEFEMTEATHEYEFETFVTPRKRDYQEPEATTTTDYMDVRTDFTSLADGITVSDCALGTFPTGTVVTVERAGIYNGGATKQIQVGFATNIDNAYDVSQNFTNGTFYGPDANTITLAAGPRHLVVRRKNTSGGAATFGATLKLKIVRPL